MSIQERRAIVSIISSIVITAIYTSVMLQRYPEVSAYSPEVFRFWGFFIMILIPVSVVAQIIISIVFSIINTIATRENEPSITDERDRLIGLKATRNAMVVFIFGFLLAMFSQVIELPPSTMFIFLIGAGFVSSLVTDISQFYFYRRGY